MLNRVILSFLLLLIFSCTNKPKAPINKVISDGYFTDTTKYLAFNKSFTDSLDTYFSNSFNGVVLFAKGNNLFQKAYGFSDKDEVDTMQLSNIFQLASVSKTVTATGVMLLAQEQKINIDSTFKKYVTDFPHNNITIRQLLSHRSGLANYMYFTDTFWKDAIKIMTTADMYEFYLRHTPTPYLMPDVSFSYCNTNYVLLAILIEKVSGMAFPQFIREKIFKPAGMRHSFYYGFENKNDTDKIVIGRFQNYEYTDKYYLDGVLGDKSLYSTVGDLLLFHKALKENRILKPKYFEQMQQPSYDYNVYGGSYGLGFRLKNLPNGKWVYHNGWWRGFFTHFWNRFDKNCCFIVLTNNKKSSHIDEWYLGEMLLKTQ